MYFPIALLIVSFPAIIMGNVERSPEIVAISRNTTALPLNGVHLLCVAISNSSIIWKKDNITINSSTYMNEDFTYDLWSYKLSFLRFCRVEKSNEGTYTCSIQENNSTVEQDVSLQIKEKYVKILGGEQLNCTANGFHTPVNFTWYKDGDHLSETFSSFSAALNLQCPMENGIYRCKIKHGDYIEAQSVAVTIPLEITEMSQHSNASINQNVTLQCHGMSHRNKNVSVLWIKNGTEISGSNQNYEVGGSLSSSLTLSNIQINDFGVYTCKVTDGNCSTALNTTLTDSGIDERVKIIALSVNSNAYAGASIIITCAAQSMHISVTPNIAWKKDYTDLSKRTRYTTSNMSEQHHGKVIQMSHLQICNLTEKDSGMFICDATNKGFKVTNSINLTVVPSDKILSIEITEESSEGNIAKLYLYEEDAAKLTCSATGGPRTMMTLKWRRNNAVLVENSMSERENETFIISSTYELRGVTREDKGFYFCEVRTNGHSLLTSVEIDVGPNFMDVELAIVTSDAVSNLGLGVMFTCVGFVKKNSSIYISWIGTDNKKLDNGGVYCIVEREFMQGGYRFMQSFLQIKGLMCANAGTYTCSVTDGNDVYANHSMNLYIRSSVEIVGTTEVVEGKVGGEARLVCMANSPNNDTMVNIIWTSSGIRLRDGTAGIIQSKSFQVKGRKYSISTLSRCQGSHSLTFADNSIFRCEASNDLSCSDAADIDLIVREEPILFQIRFNLPIGEECKNWKKFVPRLTSKIIDVLRTSSYCNCVLYYDKTITYSNESICPTDNSRFLIYRARLSGTRMYSIKDLTKDLERWVSKNPTIQENGELLQIDSKCPLNISSFDDKPCQSTDEKQYERSSLEPAIMSGIILTAIFTLGIVAAIAVIILLRRKAEKASISAVYNYVDAYQYRMYYGTEGQYEELNDYEYVDGSGSKYKYSKCGAYNKTYIQDDDYNHYEPTNEGIYDINTNAAYDKAKIGHTYDMTRCGAYTTNQNRDTTTDGNKLYERIDGGTDSKRNSEIIIPQTSPKSFNPYEFIDGKSLSSVNYEEGAEITADVEDQTGGHSIIETTAF